MLSPDPSTPATGMKDLQFGISKDLLSITFLALCQELGSNAPKNRITGQHSISIHSNAETVGRCTSWCLLKDNFWECFPSFFSAATITFYRWFQYGIVSYYGTIYEPLCNFSTLFSWSCSHSKLFHASARDGHSWEESTMDFFFPIPISYSSLLSSTCDIVNLNSLFPLLQAHRIRNFSVPKNKGCSCVARLHEISHDI